MEQRAARNFLSFVLLALTLVSRPAEGKDQLRVGFAGFSATTEVILLVTQGAGLFEKNDLKVELISITGAAPATMALNRGELDIDIRAPVNAIAGMLKGLDFTFIGVVENYLDYAIVTRPEVNGVADLKGKRVGIVRFGGKTDLLVRYLFRRLGLEAVKDFAILQVGEPTVRVGALQTGAIDATVLPPPQAYGAVRAGLKIVDVPYAPFFQGVLITRQALIKKERYTLTRFLKAYVEGIQFFFTRKEETLKILSRFLRNTDRGWLEHVHRTHQQHQIGRKPFPDWEAVQTTLDMMAPDEPAVKKLRAKELFDLSILEELNQSGFIDALYQR